MRSFSTTTSAGAPTRSRPSSGSPSTRAGVDVAAASASSIGRRAHAGSAPPRSSSARCLRARRPGPRTVPSCTCTSRLPRLYEPSATPAPVIASVTSASRPRAARPRDARRLRRKMDAVDDHRDDHVVACERSADDARVAVQERAHRVEEVRHAPGAAVERGIRLLRPSRRYARATRRRRARAAGRSAAPPREAPARGSSAAPARRRAAGRGAPSPGRDATTPRACRAGSATGTAPRGACRGCAVAPRRPAPRASPRGVAARGS